MIPVRMREVLTTGVDGFRAEFDDAPFLLLHYDPEATVSPDGRITFHNALRWNS
jgi:hypothetical protein